MFGNHGEIVIVSDTLHMQCGDYKEVARIFKKDGRIEWKITKDLDKPNKNINNFEAHNGTIREVVERMAGMYAKEYAKQD